MLKLDNNELNRLTAYRDPFGNIVRYDHDFNGNRTSVTYPDGKKVAYTYDPLNRLSTVMDWLNRTTIYSYDNASRLSIVVNPNATRTTYSYDMADRLTGLANAKGDGTIISRYNYTLDSLGNHRQVVQDEPLPPNIPAQNITYNYDEENRLTSLNGVSISYDANGNMKTKGTDMFTYDYNDRLIQSNVSGAVNQYQYDGIGNRLVKTENGVTTKYIFDISGGLTNVIGETDGAGNMISYYVYGRGLVSKVLPTGTAYYYHYDSRGSTIALTDSGQDVTDAYAYDPFGTIGNHMGTTVNPFQFTGQYGMMQDSSGLNHSGARYYSPPLGRFLTKGFADNMNGYNYAFNNPMGVVDVSGFVPQFVPENIKHYDRRIFDYQASVFPIYAANRETYKEIAGWVGKTGSKIIMKKTGKIFISAGEKLLSTEVVYGRPLLRFPGVDMINDIGTIGYLTKIAGFSLVTAATLLPSYFDYVEHRNIEMDWTDRLGRASFRLVDSATCGIAVGTTIVGTGGLATAAAIAAGIECSYVMDKTFESRYAQLNMQMSRVMPESVGDFFMRNNLDTCTPLNCARNLPGAYVDLSNSAGTALGNTVQNAGTWFGSRLFNAFPDVFTPK